jgi:hypothetical protein
MIWSTVATTTAQPNNGTVHCRTDATSPRRYCLGTADSAKSTKSAESPASKRTQARDKHRDFMSHHPPAFCHSVYPLDADDWLKVIGKMLDIT